VRKFGLVLFRIMHRKGEAIDEFDVTSLPQPRCVPVLFGVVGNLRAEFTKSGFGKPGSSATIVTCVCGGSITSNLQAEAGGARHSRLTQRFLAIPRHLSEKRN